MGPAGVVELEPFIDDDLGLEHGMEHLAVEQLATHRAVDVAVLLRAGLLDELTDSRLPGALPLATNLSLDKIDSVAAEGHLGSTTRDYSNRDGGSGLSTSSPSNTKSAFPLKVRRADMWPASSGDKAHRDDRAEVSAYCKGPMRVSRLTTYRGPAIRPRLASTVIRKARRMERRIVVIAAIEGMARDGRSSGEEGARSLIRFATGASTTSAAMNVSWKSNATAALRRTHAERKRMATIQIMTGTRTGPKKKLA